MQPHTARLGVAALDTYFSGHGWLFREQLTHDYGIDAHVEIVDGPYPSGKIIAFQIKSGTSFFKEETPDAYVFRTDDKHIGYWLNHAMPVVIVLYHPDTKQLFWQNIAKDTAKATGKHCKVLVPKAHLLQEGDQSLPAFVALTQPELEIMATKPRVELPIGGKIAGKSAEYEILERLNAGANGVVYRARTGAGDIVAVKLFSLRDPVPAEDREKFRKSFKNEVTKTRLVSHWAVIGVQDWGEVNLDGLPTPFWVMELAPSDLRKVLDAGSLGLFARCFLSAVLCEAVDYINTRGQIHRDIKPENILLDGAGLPKIADLGIAEFIPDFEKKALEGYDLYTEPIDARRPKHYLSPEQMRREIVKDKNPGNIELLEEVDLSRSDLFQLGKVIYEVFTGINPSGQLDARSRAMQVVPGPVRNLLIRMQSQEEDERPSLETCVAFFYGQAALSLWKAEDEFLRLAKITSKSEREAFLAAFRNGDGADPYDIFSYLQQAPTMLPRWEKRGLIERSRPVGKPAEHRQLALTPFGRDVRDFLALREPWSRLLQIYRTLGRAPSHRLHEWGTEAWMYENPRRATSPEQLAFCPKFANDWSSYILCPPMNIGGRWWAEVYEGDHPIPPEAAKKLGSVIPERLIGFQAPRWVKSGNSPQASLAAVRSKLLEAGIPRAKADKAIAKALALVAK